MLGHCYISDGLRGFKTEGDNLGSGQVTAGITRFAARSLEQQGASLVLMHAPVGCQTLCSLRRAFDIFQLLKL